MALAISSTAPSCLPLRSSSSQPASRKGFQLRANADVASETQEAQVQADEAPPSSLPLPQQKIRVKLRAYFAEYVDEATKMVAEAAKRTGAEIMGPVPLPTTRRVYCLLRSPHVNKNSMEHWEIRTHKRLLDIKNPNPKTIDALMQLDIRTGVDVEVKL